MKFNDYLFDHHPHLLGGLVEGGVEEDGNMFMLVNKMDEALTGNI